MPKMTSCSITEDASEELSELFQISGVAKWRILDKLIERERAAVRAGAVPTYGTPAAGFKDD